jgi:hypothetical protein
MSNAWDKTSLTEDTYMRTWSVGPDGEIWPCEEKRSYPIGEIVAIVTRNSRSDTTVCITIGPSAQGVGGPAGASGLMKLADTFRVGVAGGIDDEAQLIAVFNLAAAAALNLGVFFATMRKIWAGDIPKGE